MNENYMKVVLEDIARRAVPEDVNLMPDISARLDRKSFMTTLRTKPVLLMVTVLLALVLLTGIVYAVGNLLGYVPGIGLVDQSAPIRVLETPVQEKQAGLTIAVLNVIADATQTIVVYSVAGIPVRMDSQPICGLSPILRLPNGTELKVMRDANIGGMGSENGFPMSYETQISYAPVSANIEDIVLVFPCILPIGKGPENWQVQIHLVPCTKKLCDSSC